MSKHHPPYTPEFPGRILELVGAGCTPESLSREFHVTAQSVRN
jgi:transposase